MTRPSPSWRLSHKSSHWPARTRHATQGRHLGGKFVLSLPHRYLCGGRNVKTRATVQTLCDRPGRRGRPPQVRPTPPKWFMAFGAHARPAARGPAGWP